ncbi:MAG: nicotinate (nicotinamide) nucleotide adenylyltransferase [Spirochaetaceae bacterium]|nr:nicotinate (nicotinamide) nucleotide adenylyltransferase [Spirochaetaceae bacterium]
MKLAILGGSFNPVHTGHLYLAELALSAGYDRVILVPAFVSPFKPDAGGASPRDRLDMLAAALAAEQALALDDCEIRREGVSYTIDTLDDITRRYRPTGKPALLLGDDLARNFKNWRNAREIAEKADIIITRRLSGEKADFSFPAMYLDNPILNIASREIRRAIRSGDPWRSLVPPPARFIIEDRGLYGLPARPGKPGAENSAAGTDGIRSLTARVEAASRAMLNPARFLHSRGVALTASALARRFGLDPDAAYLAGIAHDMAKELSDKEMRRYAKRDREGFSALEKKKPSLLHGRAAAALLRDRFGVEDMAVLEAIRLHTAGGDGMGDLAKIVYIADKTEPARMGVGADLRTFEQYPDLETYFARVFRETVAYLEAKQYELSPATLRLLESMRGKGYL